MFYESIKIYGRSGKELHDIWQGKPTGYAGVQIADMPNLCECFSLDSTGYICLPDRKTPPLDPIRSRGIIL